MGIQGNGEPFGIMIVDGQLSIMAYSNDAAHTVKIVKMQESVVTIDPKYLPEIKTGTGKMVGGKEISFTTSDGTQVLTRMAGIQAEVFNALERNRALGEHSHAEGGNTSAIGDGSHAEGYNTIATGQCAHVEGFGWGGEIIISGEAASKHYTANKSISDIIRVGSYIIYNNEIVEVTSVDTSNSFTLIRTLSSDALNNVTVLVKEAGIASGRASHAEGYYTIASGNYSHSEGKNTTASGESSHAEGINTKASGDYSHAEGSNTIASGNYQHVQGKYNIEDTENKYAHIVGNGNSSYRSNAHTVDLGGNAWFSGDIYTGSTSGKNKDEGSKKLATEEYVATELANLVGAAPETLDTIEELATAFQENKDVVETLNNAITNKADKTDLEAFATKEYVDEKLPSITGTPRLVTYTFPIVATEDGQTVFTIDLESFNSFMDTVMVQDGRTMLLPNIDFTVVDNTVVLTEGWNVGDTGGIYVFRVEMYYPLTNITITTPPAKTTYYQNEYFDITGMVVTATHADGTTKEITNYSYAPNDKLTSIGTNTITISYSENGVTKTCELNIEVLFNETILQDFEYTHNGDGTYTLVAWKGTTNGEPGTEILIPGANGKVILE